MTRIDLRLRAEVYEEDGKMKLKFNSPRHYQHQLQRLKDSKKVIVTISNERVKRSLDQNAYWHGICFPILAEMTGHTQADIKEITKKMFIKPKILTLKGKEYEVSRGTSELEKWEGVEYTEALFSLARDLGGHIPSPAEAGYT